VGLLHEALPPSTVVVAIDPGEVSNRVRLSTGETGEMVPPLTLPVLRPGLEQLHRLVIDNAAATDPVYAQRRRPHGETTHGGPHAQAPPCSSGLLSTSTDRYRRRNLSSSRDVA
jgi:hypothetical protein